MITTNRNQDVPGFHAGDAQDMQTMANSYRKNIDYQSQKSLFGSHHSRPVTSKEQGPPVAPSLMIPGVVFKYSGFNRITEEVVVVKLVVTSEDIGIFFNLFTFC